MVFSRFGIFRIWHLSALCPVMLHITRTSLGLRPGTGSGSSRHQRDRAADALWLPSSFLFRLMAALRAAVTRASVGAIQPLGGMGRRRSGVDVEPGFLLKAKLFILPGCQQGGAVTPPGSRLRWRRSAHGLEIARLRWRQRGGEIFFILFICSKNIQSTEEVSCSGGKDGGL